MLFTRESRRDPSTLADRLARWNLARLSQREGVQVVALLREYRTRFDHFREVRLFTTTEPFLISEGALCLGQHLADKPNMLLGTIVAGLATCILEPLNEVLAAACEAHG
jgi:hypothetical protein